MASDVKNLLSDAMAEIRRGRMDPKLGTTPEESAPVDQPEESAKERWLVKRELERCQLSWQAVPGFFWWCLAQYGGFFRILVKRALTSAVGFDPHPHR